MVTTDQTTIHYVNVVVKIVTLISDSKLHLALLPYMLVRREDLIRQKC